MNTILVSGFTQEEFISILRNLISDEVRELKKSLCENEEYLSAKEVQNLFNPSVSRTTIHNWSKKGLLKKHFIGGRVYFSKKEIQNSLNKIKCVSNYELQ